MERFRRSVFGGYRKNEVEARLWELEKQSDQLTRDNAALEQTRDQAAAEAEQLKKDLKAREDELLTLKTRLAQADAELEKSRHDDISAVIGNVYLKAYESGSEILRTSKEQTDALLADVEQIAAGAKQKFTAAGNDFSAVSDTVARLVAQVNEETARLQTRVNELTDAASGIFTAYDGTEAIRRTVDRDIRTVVQNYEQEAISFSAPAAAGTRSTVLPSPENAGAEPAAGEAPGGEQPEGGEAPQSNLRIV